MFERVGIVQDQEGSCRQILTDENDQPVEIRIVAEFIDNNRYQVQKTGMRDLVVTRDDLVEKSVRNDRFSPESIKTNHVYNRLTKELGMKRHGPNDETHRPRPRLTQFHRRTIPSETGLQQRC